MSKILSNVSTGLMPGFYGNSVLVPTTFGEASVFIEINFAVYDSTSGTTADPWGTGKSMVATGVAADLQFAQGIASPSLQTDARYLYLYQLAYDGSVSLDVELNLLALGMTSWGNFANTSFLNRNSKDETARLNNTDGAELTTTEAPRGATLKNITSNDILNIPFGLLTVKATLTPNLFTSVFGFTTDFAPEISPPDAGMGRLVFDGQTPQRENIHESVIVFGISTTAIT